VYKLLLDLPFKVKWYTGRWWGKCKVGWSRKFKSRNLTFLLYCRWAFISPRKKDQVEEQVIILVASIPGHRSPISLSADMITYPFWVCSMFHRSWFHQSYSGHLKWVNEVKGELIKSFQTNEFVTVRNKRSLWDGDIAIWKKLGKFLPIYVRM
jgi:hypothetical protein